MFARTTGQAGKGEWETARPLFVRGIMDEYQRKRCPHCAILAKAETVLSLALKANQENQTMTSSELAVHARRLVESLEKYLGLR